MNALPWLLLASTLIVRWLAGSKRPLAWWLDLGTIPFWCAFYIRVEAWPLLAIPILFGAIDVRNLREWAR